MIDPPPTGHYGGEGTLLAYPREHESGSPRRPVPPRRRIETSGENVGGFRPGARRSHFGGSDPDAHPGLVFEIQHAKRANAALTAAHQTRHHGGLGAKWTTRKRPPILRLPMARVTVEDCLDKVPNRFALTILASRRARALSEGKGTALVRSINKVGVVALREIAKEKVRFDDDVEETIRGFIEEQRAQIMAGSASDATFIDAATFGTGDDEEEEEDDDIKELSTDPDKLQDDDDDEDEDEVEVEVEASDDDEEEATTDDDATISDDDVDPTVLEGIDDDLDEDEDDAEEPEAEDS
jgi:DNA-directed RNA polymerase omega subunit